MIHKESFSRDWILGVKGHERSDPSIIERQIYALHLLEELRLLSNEFIFKGGTSLSLINKDFPRFSVDIDILVNPKFKNLFKLNNLKSILSHSQFTRIIEDQRTAKYDIDKAHFQFYFNGVFAKDTYVLLDIVFEKSHYLETQVVKIENYLIYTYKTNTLVEIPSINDLLADKLGAFAPTTIGKKLGEGRDIEVIKQMYDVYILTKDRQTKPSLRKAYETMADIEIKRRGLDCGYKVPLFDTIKTASNIISEGKLDPLQYELLKEAGRKFSYYLRSFTFDVQYSKSCALNCLLASLLVLSGGEEEFERISKINTPYLDSYKMFIPFKKWLRRNNINNFDNFEKCLFVLGYFQIEIV